MTSIFNTNFNTPYQIPPFDKFSIKEFNNALESGIRQQISQIDKIKAEVDEPTFENTILALENSGDILKRLSYVIFNLSYCHTNDELQDFIKDAAPRLSNHSDQIYLDQYLWTRVLRLWENKDNITLDNQDLKLLEYYYKLFKKAGAMLSSNEKLRMSDINQRLTLLALQFSENLLNANNDYVLLVKDINRLQGLPKDIIETSQNTADEKGAAGQYGFTLHNASIIPFLTYANDRELRREIWTAMASRCNPSSSYNNHILIKEIIQLRSEKAKMLGYKDYASLVLEDKMAKNTDNVMGLLNQIWEKSKAPTEREYELLSQCMHDDGIEDTLQAYDWHYYSEKIRKEKFNIDEEGIKPFLELSNVIDGLMNVVNKLYDLHFIKCDFCPSYHEDVITYEVREKDRLVGVLMMDYFQRKSKISGAWMTSYKEQFYQGSIRQIPIISIVCNFAKPIKGKKCLLTNDDVRTLFHEFGHALHGLLSDVKYASLAGTNVATDFVELPSQILENWAEETSVISDFAKHHDSGDPLDPTWISQMQDAKKFGQGFAITEYLAAALLDMHFHTIEPEECDDIDALERNLCQEIGLHPAILPRYRSGYFSHIFAGGYGVGYYSYIWSEVLDADAFRVFKEKGLFDKSTSQNFKNYILSTGASEYPDVLYRKFRGKNPDIVSLLQKRGLNE
jgi:peptidyl-dipeptidase Dcp